MSNFNKPHAVRNLGSKDAAQDIDANFDAIFAALRTLRSALGAIKVPPIKVTANSSPNTIVILGEDGPPGEDGAPGPPGTGTGGGGGGGGVSADYVVLSDGVVVTPSPVDDGAGNFIYVAYTP